MIRSSHPSHGQALKRDLQSLQFFPHTKHNSKGVATAPCSCFQCPWIFLKPAQAPEGPAKAKMFTCMKMHERKNSHISFLDVPCMTIRGPLCLFLARASSPSQAVAWIVDQLFTRTSCATIVPRSMLFHNKEDSKSPSKSTTTIRATGCVPNSKVANQIRIAAHVMLFDHQSWMALLHVKPPLLIGNPISFVHSISPTFDAWHISRSTPY